MANLSQLTLPVKDTITGQVTQQTFNISGSGGGGDSANFVGTLAQWQALTQSEKDEYDFVDLTDDYYDVDEELQSMADNLYAKQDKTDQDLQTTSKTVVGAINEVKGSTTDVGNQLKVGANKFYFDSHDGQFGYNTSANRGADTFVPFRSPCQYKIQLNASTATMTLDHDTNILILCLGVQTSYVNKFSVTVGGNTCTLTSLGNIGTGQSGWGLSAFYSTGNFKRGDTVNITGTVNGYGAILIM